MTLINKLKLRSRFIYRQIFDNTRFNNLNQFYKQFFSQGDLCFDIGAHDGALCDFFLYNNCSVVAVEPIKELADRLIKKYKSNRIIVISEAISDHKGFIKMYHSDKTELTTISKEFVTSYPQYYQDITSIIKCTTLDWLIRIYGKPKFCKIDVEGHEKEVLQGLSTPIEWICFEYHKKLLHLTLDCLSSLERLGKSSFNFSVNEQDGFFMHEWTNSTTILLDTIKSQNKNGNIYVHFEIEK